MSPPSSFSSLVGDVFEKVYGVRVHINILRHSRITNFLKEIGQRENDFEEREAFATACGHSYMTAGLYARKDEKNSEFYDQDVELHAIDVIERDAEDDDTISQPPAPVVPTTSKPVHSRTQAAHSPPVSPPLSIDLNTTNQWTKVVRKKKKIDNSNPYQKIYKNTKKR